MKALLKDLLLKVGAYYKINEIRFRHNHRDVSQKAFYATIIGPDDLVFDVGANVGQRSAIFSQLARMVVAFEPQPQCLTHLKSRFKFKPNVRIEPIALGATDGEAIIYQSSSHDLSSMSPEFIQNVAKQLFSKETWNETITVPTRTLDQMIASYGVPHFIKIDVEGFELNVLNGLSCPVQILSFEFTPLTTNEAKRCVDRLHQISANFLYNYCLGEELDFVLPDHVDYQTFSNNVLPGLEGAPSFGDIYAVMRSNQAGKKVGDSRVNEKPPNQGRRSDV
jgi:FkbM family methyltransferase